MAERLTYSGTKEAKPNVTIKEVTDKLAHYEDLEEAGRLIELPCKVGDTVYGRFRSRGEEIHKCRVVKTRTFQFKEGSEPYYFVDVEFNIIDPFYNDGRLMTCGYQAVIGRNYAGWDRVFLTREEAEAALKGEKNERDKIQGQTPRQW